MFVYTCALLYVWINFVTLTWKEVYIITYKKAFEGIFASDSLIFRRWVYLPEVALCSWQVIKFKFLTAFCTALVKDRCIITPISNNQSVKQSKEYCELKHSHECWFSGWCMITPISNNQSVKQSKEYCELKHSVAEKIMMMVMVIIQIWCVSCCMCSVFKSGCWIDNVCISLHFIQPSLFIFVFCAVFVVVFVVIFTVSSWRVGVEGGAIPSSNYLLMLEFNKQFLLSKMHLRVFSFRLCLLLFFTKCNNNNNYSFMCYFSRLEHIAHCKAKTKTQSKHTSASVCTYTLMHTHAQTQMRTHSQ